MVMPVGLTCSHTAHCAERSGQVFFLYTV